MDENSIPSSLPSPSPSLVPRSEFTWIGRSFFSRSICYRLDHAHAHADPFFKTMEKSKSTSELLLLQRRTNEKVPVTVFDNGNCGFASPFLDTVAIMLCKEEEEKKEEEDETKYEKGGEQRIGTGVGRGGEDEDLEEEIQGKIGKVERIQEEDDEEETRSEKGEEERNQRIREEHRIRRVGEVEEMPGEKDKEQRIRRGGEEDDYEEETQGEKERIEGGGGGRGEEEEDGGLPHVKRVISWSVQLSTGMVECTAVETAEEWMVDFSKLLIGQRFACGRYSRLYRGLYKEKEAAVKILRLPDDDGDHIAQRLEYQFRCEVQLLSRLHHPNIVKLMGACKKPPVCCIVTEYLPEGSLRSFLQQNRESGSPLPFNLMIGMAADIAQGMAYMHSQGIVHRDLKSGNLVLTESLRVKVTDLGVACMEVDSPNSLDDVGTYRWMAPELICRKPHSRKVDVYSFGIVMWELLTQQIPFEEMTAVQAAFAVAHKNARPKVLQDCPALYRELMEHCWSTNPDKRPEFSQVVKMLEAMKIAIDVELSFVMWRNPQRQTNLFRCFTSCVPKVVNPS